MGRPVASVISFLSLLCVVLYGCTGDEAVREAATDTQAGGTAVIAFAEDPDVLNPLIYQSASSGQILVLLHEGLVEMGEDLYYHPHIAREWRFSPDSLTITVPLRPWRWSDGRPVTAHDAAEAFSLYMDPLVASPRSGSRLANIASVTPLDSQTIEYVFHTRRADQVPALGHFLFPAHRTRGLDRARVAEWPLNDTPISTGPYVLERWDRGRDLVLRRNDAYPDSTSRLDRLVFRIIPDKTAAVVELETGGVDFVEDIPVNHARRLADNEAVVLETLDSRLVGQIYWNLELPLFADRRVRKAMSHAIDRSVFIDGLLGGYGSPAVGPLPPALWAFDVTLMPDAYDPDLARALLAEAGWTDTDGDGILDRDGKPFAFELTTRKGDPVRENGAQVIRENLRRVGIDVRTRIMEFTSLISRVRVGNFEAYLGVFSARLSVDPSALYASDAFDRFNYGHYASAVADSLLETALALTDRASAKPVWDAFQRHVAADSPLCYLYYPKLIIGHNRRLRNVKPHILSPYQNVTEWWIPAADRKYVSVPAH
jgi:peptide/nickel transport system substrate-binding protein